MAIVYIGECNSSTGVVNAGSDDNPIADYIYSYNTGYQCPGTSADKYDVKSLAVWAHWAAGASDAIRVALYGVTGAEASVLMAQHNAGASLTDTYAWAGTSDALAAGVKQLTGGNYYKLAIIRSSAQTPTVLKITGGAGNGHYVARAYGALPDPCPALSAGTDIYGWRAGIELAAAAPSYIPDDRGIMRGMGRGIQRGESKKIA